MSTRTNTPTHTHRLGSQNDNTYQHWVLKKKKKRKTVQSRKTGAASLRYCGIRGGALKFMLNLLMSFSFPVLVHFVGRFAPTVWGSLSVATGAQVHLVHLFERLGQVVLEWGHGCADGRWAKAVGYEAEVGQGALDSGLHDGGRSRVSEGRPVLSEQVGELLADLPRKQQRRISQEEGKYLLASENKSHTEKLNLW